jgi:hypothetical protein
MTFRTRHFEDGCVTTAKLGAIAQGNFAANAWDGTVAKNVANIEVLGGIPVVHRIVAGVGDTNVVLTHKTRIIDVYVVAKANQAAGTITVTTATPTAITDAIICAVDTTVTRAGTIDDAVNTIAAGGTLRVTGAEAATSAEVYIIGVRVA